MGGKYRIYHQDENYQNPTCPVCGFDCETLYRTLNGEVIGCDQCLESVDAAEWWEEREEELRYPNL